MYLELLAVEKMLTGFSSEGVKDAGDSLPFANDLLSALQC